MKGSVGHVSIRNDGKQSQDVTEHSLSTAQKKLTEPTVYIYRQRNMRKKQNAKMLSVSSVLRGREKNFSPKWSPNIVPSGSGNVIP